MNVNKIIPLIISLAGFIVLPGCKPTEKNYKAAYDAALAKRQAEASDPDLNLPAEGYQSLDAPSSRKINGKDYLYQFLRLRPLDSNQELKAYNVAVAVYKMPTNCNSQVNDLRDAGYKAFGARSGDDRFFVFVDGFSTIEEAAESVDAYEKKNKDAVYVGLPENPVIIRVR